ncbi:hypothetical protein U0070_022497 [Myodes glareolus]|uniref:Uncharacterized protein n=1 Tax=Myodes glareolus TaxID=447135 RepID=A0AAW0HMR4_MYOGA
MKHTAPHPAIRPLLITTCMGPVEGCLLSLAYGGDAFRRGAPSIQRSTYPAPGLKAELDT